MSRLISVVVPMKDESEGLEGLFSRLLPALQDLNYAYEVVCVNDGSVDDTVELLKEYQKRVSEIVIVDLSRNFGKEAALMAGLINARGNAVIPIDADLQDPPEIIGQMVAKWEAGAEVVLAVRSQRTSDSYFKRVTAQIFYKTINAVSDIPIPTNAGDFRLMDRVVVNALATLPERTRFNKGLFAWLGFRTAIIEYERPERAAGTTKWRVAKLWSFAIDGITSFSSLPLRIWSYIGVTIAAGATLYGLWILVRTLFLQDVDVPGYASLMVAVLFSCGLILTSLGVIGEYLSRIFIEVKQRPLYVVREVLRSSPDQALAGHNQNIAATGTGKISQAEA